MRGSVFPAPAILLSLTVLVYTQAQGIQSGRETNLSDPLAFSAYAPNLCLMKVHGSVTSSGLWSLEIFPQHRVAVTLAQLALAAWQGWGAPGLPLPQASRVQPYTGPGARPWWKPQCCFCRCQWQTLPYGTAARPPVHQLGKNQLNI